MLLRAAIAVLLLLVPSIALAEKRVALVIGNSAYQFTSKLTNPKNDATDMAAALKKHGVQVIEGFDLDKASFDRKVLDFAAALKGAEAGVFFYAGHGLQVAGHNYLVPVSAKAEGAEALEFEMLRVDVIQRIMERQTNTNILFLDACRDNPMARNLARSMGTRSSEVGRGLAQIEAGVGTLISFSTQPGNVALDGEGRNSPFAGALVKQLSGTNDDLSAMLIGVRNEVMKETQRKQVPWEHSALTGRFYFNPAARAAPPPHVAPQRLSEAAEAWDRTKDTTSVALLEAFIIRFKDTFYAELARTRIDDLKKQQVAVAAPKAPAPPPAKPAEPAVAVTPPPARCEGIEAQVGNERRCLKPKDSFKDCPECPEMVVVPAGEFIMGSPTGEAERIYDEGPQHKVTIAKPLAVGKFEVTFAEWDACAMTNGCIHYPRDEGWGRGTRPVIHVSWDDITKDYLLWFKRKTGKTYRLLTEAEWEYAARAGTTTPFSTGRTITTDQANFDGRFTYGGSDKGVYRNKTIEVGSLNKPNAFGIHDMHGNVWEWVADCYHDSHQGAPTNGAFRDTGGCSHRVARGGSWSSDPRYLRAAHRQRSNPGGRYYSFGFRLARTLDP
jgi:formylglycine-generating enzyme required for sulfatase activity